jgi:hypothetical protein
LNESRSHAAHTRNFWFFVIFCQRLDSAALSASKLFGKTRPSKILSIKERHLKRLMSRTFFALLSLLFFASLASAQIPTRGNIYFGYSYENLDSMSLDFLNQNRASLNGWEAELEGKVMPAISLVADLSGEYGTQNYVYQSTNVNVPSGVNAHEFTALFGPRFSASMGKFRPFGEFLAGIGHMATTPNSSLAASFGQPSDTSYAIAIGGGLDYKIIRPLAWRFQGDYIATHYFSTSENNVRLSTGIVLRF